MPAPDLEESPMTDVLKAQVIIMDEDGNAWGPFDGIVAAAEWAGKKWPHLKDSEDSWTVCALRKPEPQ
jgi:hypothetical protein